MPNISLLLRPTMLDDLGLLPALKWLAREVSRTSGIPVDVVAETDRRGSARGAPDRRIPGGAGSGPNAVRHSGAHQIRIHVTLTAPGRLRVSIQDDGKGFAPSQSPGLGILGMEERVHRLGGRIEVDSRQTEGRSFRLWLCRHKFLRLRPFPDPKSGVRCIHKGSSQPLAWKLAALVCSTFCIAGGMLTTPKRSRCGCL